MGDQASQATEDQQASPGHQGSLDHPEDLDHEALGDPQGKEVDLDLQVPAELQADQAQVDRVVLEGNPDCQDHLEDLVTRVHLDPEVNQAHRGQVVYPDQRDQTDDQDLGDQLDLQVEVV